MSEKVLSANNLNLDSFKISAIKLMPLSPILVVAIENFGIMIYDIEISKIMQAISIQSQLYQAAFIISNIVI